MSSSLDIILLITNPLLSQNESHLSICLLSPGRCGAESSRPTLCLYPWAKWPLQGKTSPFPPSVPPSTTAAAFRKATRCLMPLCTAPSWTRPNWGNAPSLQPPPPPPCLWTDTGVSLVKWIHNVDVVVPASGNWTTEISRALGVHFSAFSWHLFLNVI